MQRKTTTNELLDQAKRLVESAENSLQAAAEKIAAAQDRGATQRQIANAVGKSVGWVNRLLQWRQGGYVDGTAFGAQSKASRRRAKHVHSPEQTTKANTNERAEAAAARARAQKAKADAARSEAEARKARADAAKAEADARTARAKEEARKSRNRSFRMSSSQDEPPPLSIDQRERMVKILGMLGSDQAGERDNAACSAERLRKTLGMTWDDLIIVADEAHVRSSRRSRTENHASN